MPPKKLTQHLVNINIKSLLKNKKFYFFLIILNSLLFPIYYGYRGVLPLDSFLIFDGGFKVLNNIHPFRDYWTITGPLLDYIQSVLFFLFSVNWFSYVLHAALINCLLAVLSYYFFLEVGLKNFFALIYSLSISILAYPQTGTPFMDHHAAIFSLLSISFLILSFMKNKKRLWFLSSLFLVFSFFSKQVPSGYLVILLIVLIPIYLYFIDSRKNNNFLFFIWGGVIGVLFFLSIFIINKIPIQDFLIQYIYYPLSIGESRISSLDLSLKNIFLKFKFIHISLIPLVITSFFLIKKKKKNKKNKKDIIVLTLIFSSALIFLYTQLLTKNQVLIFFLIPFYLGISHLFVIEYFNKKSLIYFIIFILVVATSKYHLRYNENKKFMELNGADFNKTIDARILDKKLSGLNWITPLYIDNPALELKMLNEVKKIITEDEENKIIITDYQILSALTGNLNYAPNKWFDNLSVPSKKNKYFNNYKLFFISKIKEQKIKNIYVVGTYRLDNFLFLFEKKECLGYKKINDISLKLDIKNCFL